MRSKGHRDELLAEAAGRVLLPERDDAAGVAIGKRVEQDSVEDAERGAVDGDAEGQGT
jgi:hypothetical protein